MNKQTIKTVLLGAMGGALVWWIVLSAVFGWMPAGSAEKQAAERANTALLDVLTPICVERFQQDTEKVQKLLALKKVETWNQGGFISKQGWATMPENGISENSIAKACASQILTANSS